MKKTLNKGGHRAKALAYAELVVKNTKAKKPKTKKELMMQAGYSEVTAINPHLVESSKAYQERIKELIPEDTAVKLHKKLLNASILVEKSFPEEIADKDIKRMINSIGGKCLKIAEVETFFGEISVIKKVCYFRVDNCKVQDSALDKYYKVVSGYAPEKKEVKTFNMSDLLKQINDNGN